MFQQSLDVPVESYEFRRQPVEQFRMGREFTLGPKFFAGAHDSGAKDRFPVAVGDHARGKGILFIDKPLRQRESVQRFSLGQRGERGRSSL